MVDIIIGDLPICTMIWGPGYDPEADILAEIEYQKERKNWFKNAINCKENDIEKIEQLAAKQNIELTCKDRIKICNKVIKTVIYNFVYVNNIFIGVF